LDLAKKWNCAVW